MPVRRPMFRPRGGVQFIATQRIKMAEELFIEPGELIPANTKRATLHRWFRRRMIGPVGEPWTVALLERRARHLLADRAAKRLYPGGQHEIVRIRAAQRGEPVECRLQERAAALEAARTAAREGAAGKRKAENDAAVDAAAAARLAAKRAPVAPTPPPAAPAAPTAPQEGQAPDGAQGATGAPTGAEGATGDAPPPSGQEPPTSAPEGAGDAALVDAGLGDPDDAHVEPVAEVPAPAEGEPEPEPEPETPVPAPPAPTGPGFALSTEPPASKRGGRRRPHHH